MAKIQNRVSTLISIAETVPTSCLLFYASKLFTCRSDVYDCQKRFRNISFQAPFGLLVRNLRLFIFAIVCPSSIYGFWLPLWYLQTLLLTTRPPSDIASTNKTSLYAETVLNTAIPLVKDLIIYTTNTNVPIK